MKKLLTVVFLFSVVRLLAVNPVPFTEALSYTYKINGTGTCILTIYDETGTNQLMTTASGSTIESSLGTAWLIPGKSYTLQFWGLGPPNYTMSFTAPAGYSVYVNGVATNLVSYSPGTGWHLETYTIELRPLAGEAGGMWGEFSGIKLGKAISWGVGLGDLRTGRSAGGIQFKKLDLGGSPATREMLFYAAPPANVGQIVVIKDGPSNQRLRQIVTPIGFTDLVDVAGGYEIRFYTWSQPSWNGTLYTFTGSPWKTIKVESPAANQLKITETEGAVVRVSNLVGSGSTSETGGTITYVGSNTQHTFTSGGTLALGSAHSGVAWLVVGGGGGGGSHSNGGGGGGGSVEYLSGQSLSSGSYAAVVGNGGAADANGQNSSFNSTTAYGGGHGASASVGSAPTTGGSGGGGWTNGGGANAGSGSNVRAGGGGDNGGSAWQGGGGGGANSSQNQSQGGGTYNGGAGLSNSISGTATYYGGGGGGGTSGGTAMTGGLGGGGAGGRSGSTSGVAGAANTGGGGGGSAVATAGTGGAGGSGIVIVSYPSPTMIWTLQEGDATNCLRTTIHTSTVPAAGQRDVVVTVNTTTGTYASPSNTVVAKTKYHYVNQAWGEELDSVIADPDTAALTTSFTYYTNSANLGNYRKVKSVTEPTGNWTVSEYYDDWDKRGQLKYEYHPYLDSPSAASSYATTTGRVIYLEYSTADWTGRYTRPTLREERINNTLVGKTTWSHGDNVGSGEPRAFANINSYRDGSNYQTAYAETYRADADPDFVGRLYLEKQPDQSLTAGSVSRGTFNTTTKAFTVGSGGDHWRELRLHGSTNGAGADSVAAFNGQVLPTVYVIPNKSTLEVTIRIAQGYLYRTETWVYTGSGNFSLMTAEDFDYDATGHLTQRWASTGNGALTSYVYTNGRLTSQYDIAGTETQFTYDLIGRVATTIKKGASASGSYAAQGDITTTNTYDGAGHVTQAVISGGALSQTATAVYDLAGRLTSSVAPGSYTTGYAYTSSGKIVTATLPGGATKITEVYLDGQPKSVTGTAVVAQYSGFSVNGSTGNVTRQANFGTSSSTNLGKVTTDWLGRQITEVRPGWNGSDVTKTWYYNSSGQLYKFSQPGLADTLYTYNTLGGLTREGLDIGANGALDLASSDRITDHDWTFFTSSSNWWRRETTSTYATTSSSTATQTAKVETQLNGLIANRLAVTYATDIFGNVTSSTTDVDRSGKKVYTTTDVPDSSTDAQKISYNGLQMSARDTAGITMTYGYDALGRQTTSVDPRTGTTTTAYVTGTSQILSVTDPASIAQVAYTYDSAGRVATTTNALSKVCRYAYTDRNEKYRVWGDTDYPVEYGYDNWGRQTTMKTYRAGTGWTGSSWPTATTGTADTTTWAFHEPTGLLSSKTDAASKAVGYTYTQAGQIDVRTWARTVSGSALTTTYSYSSTTAELTGVNYSDATTDLAYTYNRLGNNATVTDATGTRTFNYNLAGTLELQSEDLPSYFSSRRLTYPRATSGVIGRPTGLQLGTSGSPTADQSITYGYASDGRVNSIAGGGQTFAYAYATNSHLISTVTNSAANYTDTRAYDATHDWTDSRVTTISSTTKASFAYVQDNLGRLTSVAKTGEVFNRYGNGTEGLTTYYGYDDRSQLTSEVTKVGTDSTVLTGRDDAYAWDTIGNRSSTAGTTHNSNTASYTTNALNQYTARTVPGVFDVAGGAASAATVTVNASSSGVTRHGDYFFKGQSMSNNPNPVFSTLAVSDGTTTYNLPAFTAGTPEAMTYDDDGNLLSDGRWNYTYDAENRLLTAETVAAAVTVGVTRQKLTFAYDYLGRRVSKLVQSGWNGSSYTVTDLSRRFVYSSWSTLAEIDPSTGNLTKSYFWGLDLGGTGGVGGLLMAQEGGNSYLPAYDALGNVHGMIKASDGSLAAAYEYDAFGQTLRESGPYAALNPFRYSTKFTDTETSLVYYGLRYFSPTLGRFINRDPIGEQGGMNLYGFCFNNAINKWDNLGLDVDPPEGWDSWDDYNSYVQSIMPTQQTESGWNWYYSGDFVGSMTGADRSFSFWDVNTVSLNNRGGGATGYTTDDLQPGGRLSSEGHDGPSLLGLFGRAADALSGNAPQGKVTLGPLVFIEDGPNSSGQQTALGTALDSGGRYAGAFNETLKFWKWPQAIADFAGGHVASAIYFPREYFNPLSETNTNYLKWQFGTAEGYGSLAGTGFLGSLAPVPKGPAPILATTETLSNTARGIGLIEDFFGGPGSLKYNKYGDAVLLSPDGQLKIRFDIKDPWMNDVPHFHIERLGPDGKWIDAGSQHRYPINPGGGGGTR